MAEEPKVVDEKTSEDVHLQNDQQQSDQDWNHSAYGKGIGKGKREVLSELGFSSLEEGKKMFSELLNFKKEIEARDMSQIEKLQKENEELSRYKSEYGPFKDEIQAEVEELMGSVSEEDFELVKDLPLLKQRKLLKKFKTKDVAQASKEEQSVEPQQRQASDQGRSFPRMANNQKYFGYSSPGELAAKDPAKYKEYRIAQGYAQR